MLMQRQVPAAAMPRMGAVPKSRTDGMDEGNAGSASRGNGFDVVLAGHKGSTKADPQISEEDGASPFEAINSGSDNADLALLENGSATLDPVLVSLLTGGYQAHNNASGTFPPGTTGAGQGIASLTPDTSSGTATPEDVAGALAPTEGDLLAASAAEAATVVDGFSTGEEGESTATRLIPTEFVFRSASAGERQAGNNNLSPGHSASVKGTVPVEDALLQKTAGTNDAGQPLASAGDRSRASMVSGVVASAADRGAQPTVAVISNTGTAIPGGGKTQTGNLDETGKSRLDAVLSGRSLDHAATGEGTAKPVSSEAVDAAKSGMTDFNSEAMEHRTVRRDLQGRSDSMPAKAVEIAQPNILAEPSGQVNNGLGETARSLVRGLTENTLPNQSAPAPAAATHATTALSLLTPGQTLRELKIALNPASLGFVHATLKMEGNSLSVRVDVENGDAYRHLATSGDRIVQALRAEGYAVDDIIIRQVPAGERVPQNTLLQQGPSPDQPDYQSGGNSQGGNGFAGAREFGSDQQGRQRNGSGRYDSTSAQADHASQGDPSRGSRTDGVYL